MSGFMENSEMNIPIITDCYSKEIGDHNIGYICTGKKSEGNIIIELDERVLDNVSRARK
jgi:hypothetical protein